MSVFLIMCGIMCGLPVNTIIADPLADYEDRVLVDSLEMCGSDDYECIYRYDCDMNCDGKKDVFLGTSLGRGKAGCSWNLYLGVENGYLYCGGFFFHPLAFYVGKFEGGACGVLFYERSGPSGLVSFEYIENNKIRRKCFGTICPSDGCDNEEDAKLYSSLFPGHRETTSGKVTIDDVVFDVIEMQAYTSKKSESLPALPEPREDAKIAYKALERMESLIREYPTASQDRKAIILKDLSDGINKSDYIICADKDTEDRFREAYSRFESACRKEPNHFFLSILESNVTEALNAGAKDKAIEILRDGKKAIEEGRETAIYLSNPDTRNAILEDIDTTIRALESGTVGYASWIIEPERVIPKPDVDQLLSKGEPCERSYEKEADRLLQARALDAFKAGDYDAAVTAFESLGDRENAAACTIKKAFASFRLEKNRIKALDTLVEKYPETQIALSVVKLRLFGGYGYRPREIQQIVEKVWGSWTDPLERWYAMTILGFFFREKDDTKCTTYCERAFEMGVEQPFTVYSPKDPAVVLLNKQRIIQQGVVRDLLDIYLKRRDTAKAHEFLEKVFTMLDSKDVTLITSPTYTLGSSQLSRVTFLEELRDRRDKIKAIVQPKTP